MSSAITTEPLSAPRATARTGTKTTTARRRNRPSAVKKSMIAAAAREPTPATVYEKTTCAGASRWRPSADEHHPRVFHELLHAHEEEHGLLPVDDAVVVGERDVHHRPDLDLAVDGDGPVLRLVQAEDADLREVDDRRGDER